MSDKYVQRMIGDIFEINGDIVAMVHQTKHFKFIVKKIAKHQRRQLIRMANNIKRQFFPLSKDNLVEFFSYVYNYAPPKGEFGSIKLSKVVETNGHYNTEAYISFDEYSCIITIEDNWDKFSVRVKKIQDSGDISFNIQCENDLLNCSNSAAKEILKVINRRLLDDISDFILLNLKSFE